MKEFFYKIIVFSHDVTKDNLIERLFQYDSDKLLEDNSSQNFSPIHQERIQIERDDILLNYFIIDETLRQVYQRNISLSDKRNLIRSYFKLCSVVLYIFRKSSTSDKRFYATLDYLSEYLKFEQLQGNIYPIMIIGIDDITINGNNRSPTIIKEETNIHKKIIRKFKVSGLKFQYYEISADNSDNDWSRFLLLAILNTIHRNKIKFKVCHVCFKKQIDQNITFKDEIPICEVCIEDNKYDFGKAKFFFYINR